MASAMNVSELGACATIPVVLKRRGNLTYPQLYFVDFMLDVLVYTAVLNLFDEYVDSVVIESFTVSLITAMVMKALIDAIQFLMDALKDHFREREGPAAKAIMVFLAWVILFLSKFAILWTVDIIFEDDVDLGGFLEVLIMVLVMMVARRLSMIVFEHLGPPTVEAPDTTQEVDAK
jgi:hypothetical protein